MRGPETSSRGIGLSPADAGRGDGLPRLGNGWKPCEARFDHLVEATRFDSWVSPSFFTEKDAVGNHRPGRPCGAPEGERGYLRMALLVYIVLGGKNPNWQ